MMLWRGCGIRRCSSTSLLHSREYFERIVERFPSVEFAMAYGSGVYAQRGYSNDKSRPTIDMIFATSDAESWHKENLRRHASHYAQPMRSLGAKSITALQQYGGAKVYYHPFVDLGDGNQLKYGVISTQDLETDLRDWSTMFVAGRLHKPTLTIKTTNKLTELQNDNIRFAFNASILLVPSQFELDQLFLTLTSLSYGGDPRFDFGAENADKVSNIVNANREGFANMYSNLLQDYVNQNILIQKEDSLFERTDDGILKLYQDLPESIRFALNKNSSRHQKDADSLRSVLSSRVRSAAPAQYAKGILTAGIFKTFVYLKEKFSKGILSSSSSSS